MRTACPYRRLWGDMVLAWNVGSGLAVEAFVVSQEHQSMAMKCLTLAPSLLF